MQGLIVGLIIAAPVLIVLRGLYRRAYAFSDRNVHDVIPFVREIRLQELEELLDPRDENYLRLNMTKSQFRAAQQKRMRLLLEFVRSMSHNTSILLEWGRTEQERSWNSANRDLNELTTELIKTSIEFRCGARAIQTQLHVWLFKMAIFSRAEAPSISVLRKIDTFDLVGTYALLKNAATRLSEAFGETYSALMNHAL